MEKLCQGCRYWKESPLPAISGRTGFCNLIGRISGDGKAAIASRGGSTLYTAPDFGCVLWESKEPPASPTYPDEVYYAVLRLDHSGGVFHRCVHCCQVLEGDKPHKRGEC